MDDLYLIKEVGTNYYKIGRSENIRRRIKTLEIGNPRRLKIINIYKNMGILECPTHFYLYNYKIKNEWFEFEENPDEEIQFFLKTYNDPLEENNIKNKIKLFMKELNNIK